MGTSKSNKNNTMNYKVGVWLRKKTLKMEEVQKVADKVNKWISSHKAIELHKKYGHQISDVNEYKHDIEVLRVKIDTCKAVINKMKESIERTEERYIIGAITKDKAETLERGFIERIQENEKNIIICKNKIGYIEGLMQQVIDNFSFDYERLSNEDKIKLIRTTINYATVQRGVNRNTTIVEIFNNYNEETEKVIIFSGRKVK